MTRPFCDRMARRDFLRVGTAGLFGMGLTLPGLVRIQPALISAAAVGVMIVMIAATIYHLARAEYSSALITMVLLAMATFVAYARWRILPIRPRQALA